MRIAGTERGCRRAYRRVGKPAGRVWILWGNVATSEQIEASATANELQRGSRAALNALRTVVPPIYIDAIHGRTVFNALS